VLLGEALAAGFVVEAVFVAPGVEVVVPAAVPVHRLADGVVGRVTDVEAPQGVLAVVEMADRTVPDQADFVVVGAGVADPGNAGTIVRSAEAAGADAVVFTAGSVDPYNPKCVRASAGALFHIPVVTGIEPAALGLRLVAASSRGGRDYRDADLTGPLALVVGNEAHGLPEGLEADEVVTIPHRGRAESLNVAMAATVLCFEVARQRRAGSRPS